jgi:hypothetical protein
VCWLHLPGRLPLLLALLLLGASCIPDVLAAAARARARLLLLGWLSLDLHKHRVEDAADGVPGST